MRTSHLTMFSLLFIAILVCINLGFFRSAPQDCFYKPVFNDVEGLTTKLTFDGLLCERVGAPAFADVKTTDYAIWLASPFGLEQHWQVGNLIVNILWIMIGGVLLALLVESTHRRRHRSSLKPLDK